MRLRQIDQALWVNRKNLTGVWVGHSLVDGREVFYARLGLAGGGIRTVGQYDAFVTAHLHVAHVMRVLHRRWWNKRVPWQFTPPAPIEPVAATAAA